MKNQTYSEAQQARRCNASLSGLEALLNLPREESTEITVPDLARVAVGILAWPIARLNKKDRFNGHTVRKLVQEGETTAAIEHVVTPDRVLGMPTMLTLRLLFVFMKLGYELKERLGNVPEFISVGGWNNLCNLLGMKPVQANRALIKRHLQILHSTAVTSKKAFKTSSQHEGYSGKFFLIPELKIKGEKDGDGVPYDQTYVSLSKPLRESIENNYVKTIDLDFISILKTDIAQLLYTKLSYLFQQALKRDWDYIDVEYKWLAETMGITVFNDRWLAKKQLSAAFQELCKQEYITAPLWNEWTIRIYPGVRFSMGEHAQLNGRRASIRDKRKQQDKINYLPLSMQQAEASIDDTRESILARQAAWILAGKEPDEAKLQLHGWTSLDAQRKADELKTMLLPSGQKQVGRELSKDKNK